MADKKKLSAQELTFRRNKAIKKLQKKVQEGSISKEELKKIRSIKSQLDKKIKGRAGEEFLNQKKIIKGVTDKIKDKEIVKKIPKSTEHIKSKKAEKLLTGKQFTEKIAKKRLFKKLGSKGLKAIPFIGPIVGAISAIKSGDVLAATPIGEIESLGGDTPERRAIENPSSKEFKTRMQKIKSKMLKKKLKK